MKVGITATQEGITSAQIVTLKSLLEFLGATEVHIGDCIGGDKTAHDVATFLCIKTVGHPPDNPKKRAYCQYDEMRPEAPYLERNRNIVNETDVLIGLTKGPEVLRSGTWSTIRYAEKEEKPIKVIRPDGIVEQRNSISQDQA